MSSIKTCLGLFLLLLLGMGADASAKVKVNRVYMFGFAASFTDSVVYVTDIQTLDSAYIDTKTGFLQERSLYSAQLQFFVEKQYQIPYATCVVFYNPSRKKLEREYLEIKGRYGKDPGLLLKLLGGDVFRFVAEEHYADEPADTKSSKK